MKLYTRIWNISMTQICTRSQTNTTHTTQDQQKSATTKSSKSSTNTDTSQVEDLILKFFDHLRAESSGFDKNSCLQGTLFALNLITIIFFRLGEKFK